MSDLVLNEDVYKRSSEFLKRILAEIEKKYNTIIQQIKNILDDLTRYIIILNPSNINEMLRKCEDYTIEITYCEQKLSAFDINDRIIKNLEAFVDLFYKELRSFYNNVYGADGDGNIITPDRQVLMEQKYLFSFILGNLNIFLS